MTFEDAVARAGGVVSHAQLTALGFSAVDARRAVSRGTVTRVRQGWVALPSAPPQIVRAVRVGGRLTCGVSLLRHLGVWCYDDRRIHVSLGRHTSHLSSPDDWGRPIDPSDAVALHRVPDGLGIPLEGATDPVELALMHLVDCQPRDDAVAAFDSALNLNATTRWRLDRVAASFAQKHRDVIALRWHTNESAFYDDRRRDLVLHEREYLVIRLTYGQVMHEWARVERLIRAAVQRNEHRWSARQRRDRNRAALNPTSTHSTEVRRRAAERDVEGAG
ncbi:hypothetical protein [Subtercola sp. YIM 133946]|uniref:hypothetical protein n=1 Tax=Subtercola sp. YIM 133946 TaxID=3118909 RepID=UPI002F944ECD